MKLVIELELDNAAFEDGGPEEVERILTNLAQRLPAYLGVTAGELAAHDFNGNWVGYAKIVRGKIKENR